MSYEGKNVFRNVSSQQPVYSGSSNISACSIPFHFRGAKGAEMQVVLMGHGNTLNLVHRESGQLLLSKDVGLDDDVILNIDSLSMMTSSGSGSASGSGSDASINKKSDPHQKGLSTAADDDSATDGTLMFAACSTRSLQIYVFALKCFSSGGDDDDDGDDGILLGGHNNNATTSGEDDADLVVTAAKNSLAWTVIKSWTADQSAVSCLKFSPCTYHLASGAADGGLKVWSVLNHYLTHQFRGQGGVVTTLAFMQADESLLAAGTFEGFLSVMDFSSKKVIASGKKNSASVEALSLITKKDDEGAVLLISASRDRTVTVFEAKSLNALRTVALGHPLLACAFSSPFVGVYACENGLLGAFAVSEEDYGVVVFAIRDAPKTGTEEEHSVRSIAILPAPPATAPAALVESAVATSAVEEDAAAAAAAAAPANPSSKKQPAKKQLKKKMKKGADAQDKEDEDQQQQPEKSATTKPPTQQLRHALLPETVLVADASYRLFSFHTRAADNNGGTLSKPTGGVFHCDQTDILNFDQIMDLRFLVVPPPRNHDQQQQQQQQHRELVIATNARDCYVTSGIGSSRLRGTLQGHSDIVVSVDVSSDGMQIITASKDMHCRVWDTRTLRCTGKSAEGTHSAELTGVRFVPGGGNANAGVASSSSAVAGVRLACTIGFDSVLAVWDLRDTIITATAATTAAALGDASACKQLTCTSSIAGTHDGPAYCVAVSGNGQYVATGGKDKTVKLWQLRGKKVYREGALKGHRRTISCVAFSPVDKVVVSGSNDGSVRVWSVVSLTCVRTMQSDTVPILQLGFFNRGTQIVTANADGVTRYWATAAGECVATTTPHAERAWAMTLLEVEAEAKKRKDEEEDDRNIDDGGDDDNATRRSPAREKTILILTGGADGTLVCQQDFTEAQVEELRAERRDTTNKEQQLRNNIREGDFGDAFRLALSLNHPRHLRGVVVSWMARTAAAVTEKKKQERLNKNVSGQRRGRGGEQQQHKTQQEHEAAAGDGDDGEAEEDEAVDECEEQVSHIVATLSSTDLHRLFAFTRQWLTNAKHSGAAALVVAATLRALHPSKLEKMSAFVEVAEALQAYSKRHLARLNRAQDQLFYLEYLTKGAVGW